MFLYFKKNNTFPDETSLSPVAVGWSVSDRAGLTGALLVLRSPTVKPVGIYTTTSGGRHQNKTEKDEAQSVSVYVCVCLSHYMSEF